MVGHNPSLKTLLMIETAIMDSEEHPTRTELWKNLPTKIEYQTFKTALEYLEAHGVIIFNDNTIIYTSGESEKIRKLIETRISI